MLPTPWQGPGINDTRYFFHPYRCTVRRSKRDGTPMTLWQRDPNWIAAEFADNLVMLDVESGNYFGLNRTASAIWTILEQPSTAIAVVDRLRGQFDVPADRCQAAVSHILDKLLEMGAIHPA